MNSLKIFIRQKLKTFFQLREGEIRTASLLTCNVFLLITILLLIKPIATSLFISYFGVEKLPQAFILVAFSAGLFTYLYARLSGKFNLNRLIVGFYYSSLVTILSFAILLKFGILTPLVLFLFYIWISLFALISTTQFWTLANIVFSGRQAKRIFPLLGSGAIAGGILGGYLTSLLVPFLGNILLLAFTAVLLIPCILIVNYIWKYNYEDKTDIPQIHAKSKTYPLQIIFKSKHLQYLAAIIGIGVVVSKLVDYQFSAFATMANPDSVQLTSFFGYWFSTFNVISLVIQLLMTRRIVKNLGIGAALIFLPASLMFASILLLIFPVLGVAIILKMNDGSLKQSINKAAVELLALPIPNNIKSQTKAFIDVFVDSAATGIAGIFLIVLIKALDLGIFQVGILTLILTLVWIYFAYNVRKEYILAFKQSAVRKINKEQKSKNTFLEPSKQQILNVLESGHWSQILNVLMQESIPISNTALIPKLEFLLHHEKSRVRIAALKYLAYLKREKGLSQLEKMLTDPAQEVKQEAFAIMLHYEFANGIEIIRKYLESPSLDIRMAALVGLCMEIRDNFRLRNLHQIGHLVNDYIDKLPSIKNESQRKFVHLELLKAIGIGKLRRCYPFITTSLASQDSDLVRSAIEAAIHTQSKKFENAIQYFFDSEKYNTQIVELIPVLEIRGIDLMRKALSHDQVSKVNIKAFINSAEKIDHQSSVNFLFELLEQENRFISNKAAVALGRMILRYPNLHFRSRGTARKIKRELARLKKLLAIQAFNSERDSYTYKSETFHNFISLIQNEKIKCANVILSLKALKYPPKYIKVVKKGLFDHDLSKRSYALDFLSELFDTSDKKMFLPVFELLIHDETNNKMLETADIKQGSERLTRIFVKSIILRRNQSLSSPSLTNRSILVANPK